MLASNQYKSEEDNSFGFIFEDKFYFEKDYNIITHMKLNEIKSFKIVYHRKFTFNFFIILSVIVLTFFSFEFQLLNLIFFLITTSTLFFVFFHKRYYYQLVIITKKNEIIKSNSCVATKKQAEQTYIMIKDLLEIHNSEISFAFLTI